LINETYTQKKKDIVWGFYISKNNNNKNINIIIIIIIYLYSGSCSGISLFYLLNKTPIGLKEFIHWRFNYQEGRIRIPYQEGRIRIPYQERRIRIPLTCLTPPPLCACPKPGLGLPTS
jgi:hypothetical protein